MSAFIWNANPGKWNSSPQYPSNLQALEAYIKNPSGYVYWSTPQLYQEIRVGDEAYIWLTKGWKHPFGVVAVGEVEEAPRLLKAHTLHSFRYPPLMIAAGWDEKNAPSERKTGIRLRGPIYWDRPLQPAKPRGQNTVMRVPEEIVAEIQQLISKC